MNTLTPTRFVGLDIHKAYLVAVGVNPQREVVYGPQRIPNERAEKWIATQLTAQDSVILEMTTNSWHMVDLLRPQVQSVTVVHPPHAPVIDPADYHHAVETLKELLAFWLMVNRDAPDRGMSHSFVHEALAVITVPKLPKIFM